MVGKGQIRNYYGSEKIKTNCIFHSDYKSEKVQLLGDLFPQLGLTGKGLFYNFDKSGLAHIIELDGRIEVFQKDNCIYAVACGNLLIFIEPFQKEEIPEKVVNKNNNNHQPEKVAVEKGYQNFEKTPVAGENMVYVIEAYKFHPNSRHRGAGGVTGAFLKVTQSEGMRLVDAGISAPDWQGKCYYWRYFNDADYYRLGIPKPNYNHLR